MTAVMFLLLASAVSALPNWTTLSTPAMPLKPASSVSVPFDSGVGADLVEGRFELGQRRLNLLEGLLRLIGVDFDLKSHRGPAPSAFLTEGQYS
jgi:hypothetical protein